MTNVNTGLSEKQALEILQKNGENAIESSKKNSMAAMFFSQFKDLMIIILAVATVISLLMGEGTEAVTIIAIVLLNAIMGFVQEYRTEKTLNALKALSAPMATVVRDGVQKCIPGTHVVTGDIILAQAGDKIPADGVICDSKALYSDESILTGESVPVLKAKGDKIMMGCVITGGKCTAQVTGTGMNTEMGKIADMLKNAEEEKTPLQIKLAQLGKFVAIACIVVCLAVSFIGYLQGESFMNMLLTGISLSVAAIPEGMPAIVTIVLALSVGRILKKGAVIRKLHAVETLGCAGVICSDKTGTITENKMTVKQIYTPDCTVNVGGDGYRRQGTFTQNGKFITCRQSPELTRLLTCAVLASSGQVETEEKYFKVSGDPTETAILVAAAKAGFFKKELCKTYALKDEHPFDSVRKMMSNEYAFNGKGCLMCKGAPDILLKSCTQIITGGNVRSITARDIENITFACKSMANDAMRIIGFAESSTPKSGEKQLTFLGLMGMLDPPRAEVQSAVRRCRSAGIMPVMITGDYADTAAAIARKVGILQMNGEVLTGEQLNKMTDEELCARCMRTHVYARVSPSDKLRIVRAYKRAGQVVAMTGDGVNDAPAVKEADIGVAMGKNGTDVTKEASAVVIMDDNFATIVSAVEEGRVIYQNIRRFIRYLLTGNLGEVLSMLFGMLLGLPVTLLPIQILMVNLLTDGLPAIALGMEPPDKGIMHEKPRPKSEGLFAKGLLRIIILRGILLGISTTGAYYAVLLMGGELIVARSAAYLTLVLSQMVHIFECRGKSGIKLGGNRYLIFAALASAFITIGSVYIPHINNVFRTVPVTGLYLVPVLVSMFLGPVVNHLLRQIKTWLR